MTTQSCKAKDPTKCRFHGQRTILTDLREQAEDAAQAGNAEEYLRLKERADIIDEKFSAAETWSIEDAARNLRVNGETSENETTNAVRADRHAEYVIDKAFRDYTNGSYQEKKEMLEAELLINNNKTETKALFDLEGNMLPAKLIPVESKYTGKKELIWGILEGPEPDGRIKEWFSPSKAKNEETAKANNKKKGYYVGAVSTPATVVRRTHTTLTGAVSYPEITPRWDTPFDSEDIEVLDNGQTS